MQKCGTIEVGAAAMRVEYRELEAKYGKLAAKCAEIEKELKDSQEHNLALSVCVYEQRRTIDQMQKAENAVA